MRTWLRALAPVLLCLLSACGGGGGGSSSAPLAFPMAGPINATYGDKPITNSATGGTGALTYASSDPAVATVAAGGVVTITGAGTTTITVTDANSQQSSYSLVVAKATQSITLSSTDTLYVIVGRAVPAPVASTLGPGAVTYSSSNPTVIGVDPSTGAVLAQSAGTTQISIEKAADANHTAAQAAFGASATDGTVQLSAWIGVSDTIVTATPAETGVSFYRSTSSNCTLVSITSCPNGQLDPLSSSPITDSAAHVSSTGFSWL